MEDNVITVPDVSTVNLNQVYYNSGQYILVMLLQDLESECSQSAVPLDNTNSGDSVESTVCPDSGDSCDSSDNTKVSKFYCGVFSIQFNQVTVKSLFMETVPAMHPVVPSGVSDSAGVKVCQCVVCVLFSKYFRWFGVLIWILVCSHFKI